jgi:hypothetical protein
MASQMSSQVQEVSSRDKDLFILRSRQPAVTKNVILMVVNSWPYQKLRSNSFGGVEVPPIVRAGRVRREPIWCVRFEDTK